MTALRAFCFTAHNAQRRKPIKGQTLNKAELTEAIARSADISKAAAEKALDGALATITSKLSQGDSVTLVGFGTFRVASRAGRTGRNPRTGAELTIPAARVPKFVAGKALKDAVN